MSHKSNMYIILMYNVYYNMRMNESLVAKVVRRACVEGNIGR